MTGTERAMEVSFGSTCHGAGRCMSRKEAARTFSYSDVCKNIDDKGTVLRIASQKLAPEEYHCAYKGARFTIFTGMKVHILTRSLRRRSKTARTKVRDLLALPGTKVHIVTRGTRLCVRRCQRRCGRMPCGGAFEKVRQTSPHHLHQRMMGGDIRKWFGGSG